MATSVLRAELKCERIDAPAHWSIEPESHQLILHLGGFYAGLETWLNGQRTSLGAPLPGEIWLAPAGQCYRAAARHGNVRYASVEIAADALAVPRHARALAGHVDPAIPPLVAAVLNRDIAARAALTDLLSATLDARCMPAAVPARIAGRIDALLRFIEANLDSAITVADLATEAGMSVNSLLLHFGRVTGTTPAQYVMRQRLRRARWHLAHSRASIADIAFATGFSSHAHLSATFRDRLGTSPSAWRAQHHAGTH